MHVQNLPCRYPVESCHYRHWLAGDGGDSVRHRSGRSRSSQLQKDTCMHAQIVLFDGFDPLDVIAPYECCTPAGVPPKERSAWSWSLPKGPRRQDR
jgi:hypothetical protein